MFRVTLERGYVTKSLKMLYNHLVITRGPFAIHRSENKREFEACNAVTTVNSQSSLKY